MTDHGARVVRIPCANCGGDPRNHEVLSEVPETWNDDENHEQGGTMHQICRCRGCDTVRFRQESWSSYEYDPETGKAEVQVSVYPEASRAEREPVESELFPKTVARIYLETVRALNAGSMILAGGGLRAIVEAICIDQNVLGATLQKKIDDLVLKGLLAKPQADLLHEERYIGNAALHEI